jgi:hypothetical protein
MNIFRLATVLLVIAVVTGCMNAEDHRNAVRDDADKLTVGKVQRQISVGMPGSDVVQVLGSPNIVTTDEQRREVWVYDKISTDTVYSSSSGGVMSLILGGGSSAGGGGGWKLQYQLGRKIPIPENVDHCYQVRQQRSGQGFLI